MHHNHCASAYRRNNINTASPGRLILMLFDGALRFMNTALTGFEETNVIRKNEVIHNHLLKTQAILGELQASLDHSKDPEFAQRMSDLYDFMRDQLQAANVQKRPDPVHVVIELLGGIRDSWAEMLVRTEAATTDHRGCSTQELVLSA